MVFFSMRFCRICAQSKSYIIFPSLQSVLMNDGADSNESHQEASTLLRSLNLPQHTGMFKSSTNVMSSVFFHFSIFFFTVRVLYGVCLAYNHNKSKVIHRIPHTSGIKQRSPALCVSSLHRRGATCTLTQSHQRVLQQLSSK